MIELYALRQFEAFASAGTLLEAAEILHLSQPALSRNMKKLEDELGIPLFVRRKNRTISFGICSPAPSWLVSPHLASLYPDKMLQTETREEKQLLSGLESGTYQLIVLSYEPEGEQYYTKECGKESLMFALPKGHRFARRKSLSFAEMNGENMILMNDIGFWNFVRTGKMPDSRFLTQSDRFSFNELVRSSTLPSFTTDLANRYYKTESKRVEVPISDPEASVTYYIVCLKASKKDFHALFSVL